jgi:hypothetical protein
MISVREMRFWTALAVTGLSVMTISWAASTLRYALAAQAVDSNDAEATLQPCFAERPTGPLARRLALVLSNKGPGPRADALQALLAATPMASGGWLDLAIAREGTGRPLKDVSSALAMSSLTGPHEARFMAGRAVFGLPLWDRLPPDVRRSLIGDLVGGWSEIAEAQRTTLGDDLAIASDETRAQVLAALLLQGFPANSVIEALDLAPETRVQGGAGRSGSQGSSPAQDTEAR